MASNDKGNIALLGVLGHGKTSLINKLCGSAYAASAGQESCTRHVQLAYTKTHGMRIIDTPGIESRVEPAVHLAAQKVAMEELPLSAVVVVVKTERTMGRSVENVLDFLGDENLDLLRVVGTHTDVVRTQPGYDEEGYRRALVDDLGLNPAHIFFTGKGDQPSLVEDFLHNTLLHSPKQLVIAPERLLSVAALANAVRKFDKPIRAAEQKVLAAEDFVMEVVKDVKNEVTDEVVIALQAQTEDEIKEAKEHIFRLASDQSVDTQNLVYGKAGLLLSVKLKNFMERTNRALSWDVADPRDPKNNYKRCPHCGAVWIKVEGCDDETTCGNVPGGSVAKGRAAMSAQFVDRGDRFVVNCIYEGVEYTRTQAANLLSALRGRSSKGAGKQKDSTKTQKGIIESGCGRVIAWRSMPPITEEQKLQIFNEWNAVEIIKSSEEEDGYARTWRASVQDAEARHRAEIQAQLRAAPLAGS